MQFGLLPVDMAEIAVSARATDDRRLAHRVDGEADAVGDATTLNQDGGVLSGAADK